MSENPGGVSPLNWGRLVDEALARRKADGLTQREHAALAGVSAPTMASFERGEATLSLAKAFDILRVVGLLDEPTRQGGSQERFLRESIERWQTLIKPLSADNPTRFPNGFYRIDYCLEGELNQVTLPEFEKVLTRAVTRVTGWPVFLTMTREDLAPREEGGAIETWLKPNDLVERTLVDPAHCDYWRGVPEGRMFLIRGYQEDGQETFPPGTVFDTTLPIWRLGEVLLHAQSLAGLLAKGNPDNILISLRVQYTGLRGRQLRNWANPLSGGMLLGRPARSDEVLLETKVPVADLKARLAEHLAPLAVSLFERFDVDGISYEFVQGEVTRLLAGKF